MNVDEFDFVAAAVAIAQERRHLRAVVYGLEQSLAQRDKCIADLEAEVKRLQELAALQSAAADPAFRNVETYGDGTPS